MDVNSVKGMINKVLGNFQESEAVSKVISALITVFIIRAPTGKSVGSEKVTKIGTDGFTRRSSKKKVWSDF